MPAPKRWAAVLAALLGLALTVVGAWFAAVVGPSGTVSFGDLVRPGPRPGLGAQPGRRAGHRPRRRLWFAAGGWGSEPTWTPRRWWALRPTARRRGRLPDRQPSRGQRSRPAGRPARPRRLGCDLSGRTSPPRPCSSRMRPPGRPRRPAHRRGGQRDGVLRVGPGSTSRSPCSSSVWWSLPSLPASSSPTVAGPSRRLRTPRPLPRRARAARSPAAFLAAALLFGALTACGRSTRCSASARRLGHPRVRFRDPRSRDRHRPVRQGCHDHRGSRPAMPRGRRSHTGVAPDRRERLGHLWPRCSRRQTCGTGDQR